MAIQIAIEEIKLPALRRIKGDDSKDFYLVYMENDGKYCLAKFIEKGVFGTTGRFLTREELERLTEEEFQQAVEKIGSSYRVEGVPLTDPKKTGLDR